MLMLFLLFPFKWQQLSLISWANTISNTCYCHNYSFLYKRIKSFTFSVFNILDMINVACDVTVDTFNRKFRSFLMNLDYITYCVNDLIRFSEGHVSFLFCVSNIQQTLQALRTINHPSMVFSWEVSSHVTQRIPPQTSAQVHHPHMQRVAGALFSHIGHFAKETKEHIHWTMWLCVHLDCEVQFNWSNVQE